MKLHLVAVSGNAYKVRILLSLLKVPHETVFVDTKNGAHKLPGFLALNPRGEVPALEDGEVVLWDSAAFLVYIPASTVASSGCHPRRRTWPA